MSCEESLAVAKIKSDPKYFFQICKKFSVCVNDTGPLYEKKKLINI